MCSREISPLMSQPHGDQENLAHCLRLLGHLASEQGDTAEGLRLVGYAHQIFSRSNNTLGLAQCEAVVARATARKLGTLRVEQVSDEQATEGWNLASRGYVPHAVLMKRSPRPMLQASLPL